MESLLGDIPQVVYLDDVLIHVSGRSEQDHLQKLQVVLERLESAGLHLKRDKCQVLVTKISYFGHRIDAEELHPLPNRIEAITNASVSKSGKHF